MGEAQLRGAGKFRSVKALRSDQPLRLDHLGQGRELAHWKPMAQRHGGIIGGMIDDGRHGLYLGPRATEGKWTLRRIMIAQSPCFR